MKLKPEQTGMAVGKEVGKTSTPRPKLTNPTKSSKASEKYVGSKIPNPNGGMNCGLCGKHSSEFNSEKSFHMHLAWCYRRRAPNYGQSEKKDGEADSKKRKTTVGDEHPSKKHRSNSVDSTTAKSNNTEEDPPSSSSSSDEVILLADSFKAGMHYETCDVCKEHGDVILCDSCPCIYHMRCTDIMSSTPPSGKWYCMKCREADVANAYNIHYSKKFSDELVDSWILTYSDASRRWRKCFVVATHPEKSAVMLVRWWSGGGREAGPANWLDISKGKILIASSSSSDKSGESNGAKARTPTTIPVKDKNVRFTSVVDNSRFKDTGPTSAMQQIDGEGGVSVPPLIRASCVGVGGIAALRDGEYPDEKANGHINISGNGMSDTYISANSVKAALCASGSACKAVDIAVCNEGTNVFACIRPPGHHAGRYGCTSGCLSTGFCLLNNAAIAAIYARVRWGLQRVAIVDIDVHFGNGTAELLRNDPNSFFASVHMIYGEDNDGLKSSEVSKTKTSTILDDGEVNHPRKTRASQSLGFYPARLGATEVTDNYVSVGVYPLLGASRKGSSAVNKKRRKPDGTVAAAGDEGVTHSSELEVSDVFQSIDMTMEDLDDVPANTLETPDNSEASKDIVVDGVNQADSSNVTNIGVKAPHKKFIGSAGFLEALESVIIPKMEKFRPQLLIISGTLQHEHVHPSINRWMNESYL